MYPDIINVNAAVYQLRESQTSLIQPFPLKCRELGLLLLNVEYPNHREVLLQLFRPYLTDTNYDELLSALPFVAEREMYGRILGAFRNVQESYACDIVEMGADK